jgi:hypothetical protein
MYAHVCVCVCVYVCVCVCVTRTPSTLDALVWPWVRHQYELMTEASFY